MPALRNRSAEPTVRQIGEDVLVRRIARWVGAGTPPAGSTPPPWGLQNLVQGVGDDTAIVQCAPGAPPLALTTDMLVEGKHFLPDHPPALLGRKAVESNLSDLAAAGAWPTWILVSLALPPETPVVWVRALYAGMRAALRPYACACLGGDCVGSDRIVINIAAGGQCAPESAPPLRSRAAAGQALYVTGTLGDSGAGLDLLQSARAGRAAPADPDAAFLIRRHRAPTARVAAGIAIARACPDAAMMDLSDGLALDLPRMAAASRCGFTVETASLPGSPAMLRRVGGLPRTFEDYALTGGEDYELLFTTALPESDWIDAVRRSPGGRPLRITRIGSVEPGFRVRFLGADGKESDLRGAGFHHFAAAAGDCLRAR